MPKFSRFWNIKDESEGKIGPLSVLDRGLSSVLIQLSCQNFMILPEPTAHFI